MPQSPDKMVAAEEVEEDFFAKPGQKVEGAASLQEKFKEFRLSKIKEQKEKKAKGITKPVRTQEEKDRVRQLWVSMELITFILWA